MGLTPGRTLRIEGLEGEWRVLDRMPDRWTRRIDVFMDTDVEAARAWGERRVRVTWEP
jgi:3D (Asp-Asp-Asp) domain-containing protein